MKQAEAELDHPEDGNARGKEFLRLGGRDERLTGRLSWRVIGCAVKEPKRRVNRSAVARVRRNGALEKTGAHIQAESSQTERCGQNHRTQQRDGHERIKARLGFGNGACRDVRSSIHGNLQWKK